jgi:hypothetical protein
LLITYCIARFKKKIKNLDLFIILLPLSFGIDGLMNIVRFTKISGQNFLGILTPFDKITGIIFGSGGLKIVSRWFPVESQKYFYKFPYDQIFSNSLLYIFLGFLIHLIVAALLYRVFNKLNKKYLKIILFILFVLYLVFLNIIFNKDPVSVLPIT